ncbi:MAG: DNA polymerase III subunit beta [Paludibacteraceae bacterium]|nr:DNA polymerase III subunit beta [Paludibacteraceae bacterium]
MKFSVLSSALSSHLQMISRVINPKSPLPILDKFLFTLEGKRLTLTAADMETMMQTFIDLDSAEGSGSVALGSKLLLDTLKEFGDMPLEFNVEDGTLATSIKSESGVYNLVAEDGSEYPKMRTLGDGASQLTLSTEVLNMGLNRTVFATADDENRPSMNGIYFDITMNDLTFVGSDAQKLSCMRTISARGEQDCSFILPKKPTNLLRAISPKVGGNLQVKFDDKNAVFTFENYVMVCRLQEGKYPNYKTVIPQNNPYKVTVDRVSLLNTLRRISIFSNQALNLVKVELQPNRMTVSAQDIDFSISATEDLVCSYDGDPMKIGFNSTLLVEILSNLPCDEVVLELADPSRAGLVVPLAQDENAETRMLVMPMMLND